MEAEAIALMLTTAGLAVELAYEGPPSDCPHCVDPDFSCSAQAA